MGYRFGLFNYATKSTGGYVDFDYFRVEDGNSGTAGTATAGNAVMDNTEAVGVTNVDVEIPVKMDQLRKEIIRVSALLSIIRHSLQWQTLHLMRRM
ncbi:MAG: hypothetical protein V8S08_12040 [Lachnoclostridium sp.]